MKSIFWLLLICSLFLFLSSCSENKAPTETPPSDSTLAEVAPDVWTSIPELALPQQWDSVPANGSLADSNLVAALSLKPDTIGPDPEWRIIGKIANTEWKGLLYTYVDVDVSELRLATYTQTDSVLSDVILINDQIIGILTTGSFAATISSSFNIQTRERLRSAASETDTTIISDEQINKTYQIESNGIVTNTANTTTNHVAASATHPEETEEGSDYREFRYESVGYPESFVVALLGKELEKHYYFEDAQAQQRQLTLVGVSESNPNLYTFKLDGKKLTALWQKYTKEGEIPIPKTIVFTLTNGKKQTFKLKN